MLSEPNSINLKKLKGLEVGQLTYIKNPLNIKAGKNCRIGSSCKIHGSLTMEDDVSIFDHCELRGKVLINQGTNINSHCRLTGNVNGIKIGRYCAIGYYTIIIEGNHNTCKPAIQTGFYKRYFGASMKPVSKGMITIGNDVWIGAKSLILSGVQIGDGAIISAGSVVVNDVEPYSVVACVPSVHKKYRFREEIRKQLLEIKWWNWSEEKIKRNKRFFMSDLNVISDISELIE